MKTSIYAQFITLQERNMPFYIGSIGNPKYQTIVHRPLGIEDYQLLYTVSGCGECFVNGNTFELKAGSLFYLPCGYPHEYHSTDNKWETLYITFNGTGIKGFFEFAPWVTSITNHFDFQKGFNKLYEYKKDPSRADELSVCLYAFLLKLKECLSFSTAPLRKQKDIITAALHEFSEHPQSSLSDIAAKFKISEEHFCRMFKKHTGYRPFEYINMIKIQKAKEQLGNTNLDVNEIALNSGFESHSYFSMLFKRYTGKTPTEYRRMFSEHK